MSRHLQIRRLRRAALLAASTCLLLAVVGVAPALAAFGFKASGQVRADAAGTAETQAASHPFDAIVSLQFNTEKPRTDPIFGEFVQPEGDVKTVVTDLPAGFVGNPTATPRCAGADFEVGTGADVCPDDTQIGVARVTFTSLSGSPLQYFRLYNLIPEAGQAAQFGSRLEGAGPASVLTVNGSVRTGGNYGLTLTAPNIESEVPIQNVSVTVWGVPADPEHDGSRGECLSRDTGPTGELCPVKTTPRPLIRNSSDCAASPLTTTVRAESWEQPGTFLDESFNRDVNGVPFAVEGCEKVPFNPRVTVQPTSKAAASPTGLAVDIKLPQPDGPNELGEADLRKAVVTLPEGMAVNPSSASGLGSCSEAQVALNSPDPASCPDASKVGSVEIDTPLIDHPLLGSVFLAKQRENRFGSLLAVYLAVADPVTGVVIKLPGRVATSESGRVTATLTTIRSCRSNTSTVNFSVARGRP